MPQRRYTFPKSHRLSGRPAFSAVFDARIRESRGPLTVYGLPNDLPAGRLGISISRKVGTAPKRNRIKRLLREAFRLMKHDWPRGYDLVVVVRPHETMTLAEYQKAMSGAVVKVHRKWAEREAAAGQ